MKSSQTLLILIGYRGSGKTTVGQSLAARLGWDFLDADAVLENRYQRTIRQIFAEEGEAGFREKESTILAELCQKKNLVLATGGGVILRSENRDRIKQSGFVVWLTADPETLWDRMQGDPSTRERRPALSTGGLAEVEQMMKIREPYYRECADLEILAKEMSPEEVTNDILASCGHIIST